MTMKSFDPKVVKSEGLAVVGPLQTAVASLIVQDAASYANADGLLARVRTARKTWGERMERVIRPIRNGLDEIYALNREVDQPLDAAESAIKGKMRTFKLEEKRIADEARAAQERETRRLQAEADKKAKLALAAPTAQARGKLVAAAERLEAQAVVVAEADVVPAPVVADRSTTRVVQKWRVTDWGLMLQGVMDGTIPLEAVTVDTVWVNRVFKVPTTVQGWPGFEVYDDIQIAGR